MRPVSSAGIAEQRKHVAAMRDEQPLFPATFKS